VALQLSSRITFFSVPVGDWCSFAIYGFGKLQRDSNAQATQHRHSEQYKEMLQCKHADRAGSPLLWQIPALIYTSLVTDLPHTRRTNVAQKWIDSTPFGAPIANKLLSTILAGYIGCISEMLLELMDVDTFDDGTNYIRWVPYHMQYVLVQMAFALALPSDLRRCLEALSDLFASFRAAKVESGGACEALFLIVLLSRCLCGEFCIEILPLHGFEDDSRVRYCTTYHIVATISIQTTSSSSLVASHFQVNHRPYPSIIQGMLGLRYRIRRDRCCLGLFWRSKTVWISVQGGELNTQSFCQPRHVCEEFFSDPGRCSSH
jgi:hypothetical protein